MKLRFVFLSAFLYAYSLCIGQSSSVDELKLQLPSANEDTNKVKLLLKIAVSYRGTEPKKTIEYANLARELSTRLNYATGLALAYKYIGLAHLDQGEYVESVDTSGHALKVYEALGDSSGVSNMRNNIGVAYKDQGLDVKALDYFFAAVKAAEAAGDIFRKTTALLNVGAVYGHKDKNSELALSYYRQALDNSIKLGDSDLIGTTFGNIGEIQLKGKKDTDSALYFFHKQEEAYRGLGIISYAFNNIGKVYREKKKYTDALKYHQLAYDSAVAVNSTLYEQQSLQLMAAVYDSIGNYKKALESLAKAEMLANELKGLYELKDIYAGQAFTYRKLNDFENASRYQVLLQGIKDSIYNREADLKLQASDNNFNLANKENQIQLQKVSIERQKLARNAFITGFGLILVIAVIIYRNYRNKLKVNRLLDFQKAQIETLLSNILPTEVSRELQATGEATPRFYESVSVLFTDFKGFTTIADSLSPQEVVAELSEIFTTFDNIIEKYGLEKIKTIGDAYMVAGGIPVETHDHPVKMVKAAVEIVHYMRQNNMQRKMKGHQTWELRVGIHTGPLVAGVVGRKKYAYDIWGSTVNIASRMESNGEPGQINISAATYELIKDQFDCEYRGKVYAKNVGDIDMYFVKETWVKPTIIKVEDASMTIPN